MENEIRFVLSVIGAIVLLAILWDGLRRQRRARQVQEKPAAVQDKQREVLRDALDLDAEQQVQAAEVVDQFEMVAPEPKSANLSELHHAAVAASTPAKNQWYQEVGGESSEEEEVEVEVAPWYRAEQEEQQEQQTSMAEVPQSEPESPSNDELEAEPVDKVAVEEITELEVGSFAVEPESEQAAIEMTESSESPSVTEVPAAESFESQAEPIFEAEPTSAVEPAQELEQYIMFTVIAPGEKLLGGFNLLQVLLNCGFRFGQNNIFHYHQDNDPKETCLFSLAAATDTGEFELSDMANFACKGVVIFMNTADHGSPEDVFSEMVEATERLANRLHAELRIGQSEPWNEDKLQAMHDGLLKTVV